MGHAVVVTKGTRGDLAPFVSLGAALKDRGHDVLLVSHCGFRNLVEGAGLHFEPLDTEDEWASYQRDIKLLNTPGGSSRFFERHCLPRIKREFDLLKSLCKPGHTALIARHAATFSDSLLAKSLDLRLVRVFTSPSQVVLLPLLERLLRDRYANMLCNIRYEIGLPEVDAPSGICIEAEINIGAWPEWFGGDKAPINGTLHEVGFMISRIMDSGALPREVEAFLDRVPAPVLITAGSADTVGDTLYSLGQSACQTLGERYLLLLAKPQSTMKHSDRSDCLVAPLLPFASLIRRVRAVIHHGGMGTVSHAALAGVPQLVLPEGADRPDNGARVQQHLLGHCVALSERNITNATNALHHVLTSTLIADKCKTVSMASGDEDAAVRACRLIESTCSW